VKKISQCWCGNTDLVPFSPKYLKCESCNTLVVAEVSEVNQTLVTDSDKDFYGRSYWFAHQEEDLGLPNISVRSRSDLPERCIHWLSTVLKYKLPPGKVLELGSAHGGFVALLRWAGFDATGLELSPWVVDYARQTFEVPTLLGPVEDQQLEANSLDVIVLMDVLEHLPDPMTIMGYCLNLLKSDGCIFIQTPRLPEGEAFSELVTRRDPFLEQLKEKDHLYLFSERSIKEFFLRLGCKHVQFEPAIFAHYDMFIVVSRTPPETYTYEDIANALQATSSGRLVLAILDSQEASQAKLANLGQAFESAEADRAERLQVIEDQGRRLGEVEAERNNLQAELGELRQLFGELETERDKLQSERDGALRVLFSISKSRAYKLLRRLGRWQAIEQSISDISEGLLPPAGYKGAEMALLERLGPDHLASLISKDYADDASLFSACEKHGFHLTPVHFYSPIPEISKLPKKIWEQSSELIGIELNEQAQLAFLDQICHQYKSEYEAFPVNPTDVPHQYYFNQVMFRSVDAEVLYCMIRYQCPRRVIEVGSGFSTYVAAAAVVRNAEQGKPAELFAIEPYPNEVLRQGFPGLQRLISEPVQDVDLDLFTTLAEGDVLFIDSSHVLRIDSDVRFLFLEVLPRLQPGVLVHFHDIFLPLDYPQEWVIKEHRFWNEQYLLQAFLAFNRAFEVIWAGSFMHQYHSDALKKAFSHYDPETVTPGSFWTRRAIF
jgi:2-polyprenyl-3-methyl-5-hydroxy-6-metoxy-1,4-benzoquinol methylase/predicted O-methyltransferase YrrM